MVVYQRVTIIHYSTIRVAQFDQFGYRSVDLVLGCQFARSDRACLVLYSKWLWFHFLLATSAREQGKRMIFDNYGSFEHVHAFPTRL